MDGHQHLTAAARGHRHGRPALLVLLTITAVGDGRGGSPLPVRERYEPRTFFGHLCMGDCDRFKAGFAAADANPAAARCAHGSAAFRSGCQLRREPGLDPVAAGCDWAVVNEIVDPADCAGAGTAFRRGCLASLPDRHSSFATADRPGFTPLTLAGAKSSACADAVATGNYRSDDR